jgi:hypothetical protein
MPRVLVFSAIVAALCVSLADRVSAQLNSFEASAALSAVLLESLTVVVAPGAAVFTLNGGSATNAAALPIVATTTWTFAAGRSSVSLYGYFSSASAALVHTLSAGNADIPSSRVEVRVNGGALQAFDQTVPFGAAGAGRLLFQDPLTLGTLVGVRVDALELNINLAGLSLPADAYVGTLRLRAQAAP